MCLTGDALFTITPFRGVKKGTLGDTVPLASFFLFSSSPFEDPGRLCKRDGEKGWLNFSPSAVGWTADEECRGCDAFLCDGGGTRRNPPRMEGVGSDGRNGGNAGVDEGGSACTREGIMDVCEGGSGGGTKGEAEPVPSSRVRLSKGSFPLGEDSGEEVGRRVGMAVGSGKTWCGEDTGTLETLVLGTPLVAGVGGKRFFSSSSGKWGSCMEDGGEVISCTEGRPADVIWFDSSASTVSGNVLYALCVSGIGERIGFSVEMLGLSFEW